VLVTGGAGFIGFHLSRHLAGLNYEVTLCDNLWRGRLDDDLQDLLNTRRVRFVKADLTEKHDLTKMEKNYDCVYHLAAINGTRHFYEIPHEVLRVNIVTLLNVLDWMTDTSCKKLVWLSSSETYAGLTTLMEFRIPTAENVPVGVDNVFNPRFSYAVSKIAGELLCINYSRAYDLKVSIIRPHNIYGPRMGYEHVVPQFITRIIRKEDPFKIHGGDCSRSFCYVDDCVRAIRLAAESSETDGQIINIGNDKGETCILDLAMRMFDLFGFHPKVEVLPAPEGSVKRRCPDIGKARELLGYETQVDLDEGLRETYRWYSKKALT